MHVVVDNGASCGALCDYTATLEGLCPADTVSTIVWSNGQKGPKVTGLCPNTQYWVKVNGPCVCDSISFRTPLTIKLTLAQNCDRVWANVLGGRYPYTFKWVSNNPQYSLWDWKGNNLTLGNLPNLPDNYSVTVTDAFGCTATASINVKPFTLNVQLSKKNSTCEQDNGSITATVSGANPPFQYEWKRGGSGQQWTTAKVDNIQAGTYFLTVTDKLGCQKTDYIVVMNDGKPTTLTVDTISCRSIRLPWGDSASTSGIYTHKLSGVCDTTLVWNVSISQTLIGDTTSVVICEGGSVAWNNSIYNKTGIYSYTTSTNNGCPVVNYFKLNVLNGSKTVVFNQTTCNSVLADSIEVISASTLDGCSYDSVVVWKYLRPNVNVIWLEDCKKHADSIIVGSGLCPDTTIYRWNVFTINPVIIQRTTCDAKTPASWTVSGFTLSGCPIDTMIVSIYDIPTTKTRWISDCIAHKDSIVIGAGLCPDTMIYKWNYVPILPILKYDTTCNRSVPGTWKATGFNSNGCQVDTIHFTHYTIPSISVKWLNDCKVRKDSVVIGSGLCPDTIVYRWNLIPISNIYVYDTTCNQNVPSTWKAIGFTPNGCQVDTIHFTHYDLPKSKVVWASDCKVHKDSLVIGSGLCPDTIVYRWNYVPMSNIYIYDTTCNKNVPSTWKATGFTSSGCPVDTIHITTYDLPKNKTVWLTDCKIHVDSVVIGSGLCPDTIVYRWNLIPISNIYVYDTTCNQNVPSTWKATGFTSSGCPVDTIHITTYDLPKSKTVWLNDCKVHKDSLVIGSGLCPDTIVYRWNLIPGITLEKSEKICYGEKWIAPDGTSIEVTNTVTFTTTLSGTNGQCDTTVTFIINPLFGDTITTTLTPVCDSLTAAKGTYSIIIPGNSCPILIHYITQWIPAPTIALDLVDTITCQSGGKIIAHASGNNTFINWQRNGQTLKITDTIAQDLGPGFYTLTAFDMQTGCETSASVELFAPKCETTTDTLPCRWRVFPNPAFEDQPLTLEIEGWGNGEFEITFISPDGGSVSSSKHQGTVGNQIISLNPPPAGVWILSLKNSTKCISGKIVIN